MAAVAATAATTNASAVIVDATSDNTVGCAVGGDSFEAAFDRL
jgi:hypothetical protein